MQITRTSPWYSECHCRSCDKPLNDKQIWTNDGVCPFCGHKGYSEVSCATTTKIIQKTTTVTFSCKYPFVTIDIVKKYKLSIES